jgi:hypothetical protein
MDTSFVRAAFGDSHLNYRVSKSSWILVRKEGDAYWTVVQHRLSWMRYNLKASLFLYFKGLSYSLLPRCWLGLSLC